MPLLTVTVPSPLPIFVIIFLSVYSHLQYGEKTRIRVRNLTPKFGNGDETVTFRDRKWKINCTENCSGLLSFNNDTKYTENLKTANWMLACFFSTRYRSFIRVIMRNFFKRGLKIKVWYFITQKYHIMTQNIFWEFKLFLK